MNDQQRVPVPPQGKPNPRDHECEWCGVTATKALERRAGRSHLPTQQYVFVCDAHVDVATRALAKKERTYKL